MQLVDIVKRCITDSHSSYEDRFEPRDRRQRTGASHLELHPFDRRQLFLRREFVRNRPPRSARHEPEFALLQQVVDFVHHTVYLIRQVVAFRPDRLVEFEATLHAFDDRTFRACLQAPLLQPFQYFAMRLRQIAAVNSSDGVHVHVEWTTRRQFRIQLSQAAGRCVSRA